uniref:Protein DETOXIFICATION n=1 Tax=Ananas comosus var. bracteatus TaxID=296719 RepID=A0A6V7NF33_ANACO|nr:unnamed protein product [Ananas comosus var. bracteatus]
MVVGDQTQKHTTLAEVLEEIVKMKEIGAHITAINLLGYCKSMVSVMCLGRLGRVELAGGALAVGFANVTGYSVLSGLALGIEPICAQAFGSGNPALAARALRRAFALLLAAAIPISVLWVSLHPLLLALRQDPAVAAVAARFIRFALPDLLAAAFLSPMRVYLRTEGAGNPPRRLMWCTCLAVAGHVPLSLFLGSAFDVAGVAAATSISSINLLVALYLCSLFSSPPQPQSPKLQQQQQQAVGAEWAALLRLAVPSCFAVCLEWWWYELMTIAAGYLSRPHVALAAAAIVIQTTSLMYTVPTTLAAAASARVGNELGPGRPDKARLAALVSVGLAFAGSGLGLSWAVLGRHAWARVFTMDRDVLALAAAALPVVGLCELANCPQTAGCGVLRGTARPGTAAVINLMAFYGVGAPVAGALAFGLGMGFVGLILGLLAAQVACALLVGYVVFRTDWEVEALKAVDLVGPTVATIEAQEECGLFLA